MSTRSTKAARMHARMIEALESRRLLSAEVIGDTLYVIGSSGDDEMWVADGGLHNFEELLIGVSVNGTVDEFNAVQLGIRHVHMTGGDGNDTFNLYGVYIEQYTDWDVVSVTADGGAGDDQFFAYEESYIFEYILGGEGNDTVTVNDTNVVGYDGGPGVDWLIAKVHSETLSEVDLRRFPNVENAFMSVGTLIGNDLDNELIIGVGTIHGERGNDTLSGAGIEPVTLVGGDGNDNLTGSVDNDVLDGGAGNDTLDGGLGADDLHGGDGWDTLSYFKRFRPVNVTLDTTANDGESGEGDNASDDIEVIFGGGSNDYIDGSEAANEFYGFGGDDTLLGSGGNDIVWGGSGDDSIEGGAGNDLLYGSVGNDVIRGNSGNDQLRGGNGDDWLRGDAGNDALFGQIGDDLLDGGNRADWLLGGWGQDIAYYYDRMANLTISLDDVLGNDGEIGEGDTVWSDVEIVYGGSGNDRITAGSGSQRLYGFDGHDTLIGGAAKDWLYGGNGTDTADDDDQDVRYSIEQLIA